MTFVPIVAPVRHLTRRTLPEDMLQPPSGLTPKVRTTTGRHAAVPVLDAATTIAPSSSAIPITGRHASVPRILDEADVGLVAGADAGVEGAAGAVAVERVGVGAEAGA